MATQILDLKTLKATEVFTGEKPTLESLIEIVRKEVAGFKPDLSTDKSRKEIGSLAAKVASSKVALDNLGKDYVAEVKAKIAPIDVMRKNMREELDELKVEARKPLTEWEDQEKQKAEEIEIKIQEIKSYANYSDLSADEFNKIIDKVNAIHIDEAFGNRVGHASITKDQTLEILNVRMQARMSYEKEQAELAKLRAQQKKRDEEDAIRREKEHAEAKEKARQDREAQIAKDAAANSKREAQEADERAQQAEDDRLQSEKDAKYREECLQKEAVEREEKAKADAIENERLRVECQRKLDAEDTAKREANKKHRGAINKKALEAFVIIGLSKIDARKAVEAIAKHTIPNVAIHY